MYNLKGIVLSFIIIILFSSYVYGNLNKPRSNKRASFFRSLESNRKKFKPIRLSKLTKIQDVTGDDVNLVDFLTTQKYITEQNMSGADRIVRKETVRTSTTLDPKKRKEKGLPPAIPKSILEEEHYKRKCWMGVDVKKHFEIMNELGDRYESVRNKYQDVVKNENFDQKMLDMMLKTKGAAMGAIHNAAGDPDFIPAGINLGGFSMMRLDDSIMFFHRMKLRNNTHFRVDSLHNDLRNMVLKTNLSLNDLHILGAYERATTSREPFQVFYTPTFGEIDLLLRNVRYNMEGRYRLLRNKLTIELVISSITPSDILMTYRGNEKSKKTITLQRDVIDEFLDRLKTNLDKWLKDYFNDYLVYFGFEGNKTIEDLSQYDKEKTIAQNEFADQVLESIRKKLYKLKYNAVQIPNFAVTAINGMELKLSNGVLRGLNTIHRRSSATSKKEDNLCKIDSIVGFSSLKATYEYEAVFNTGIPPINGILIVTADELITHMGLTMTENPETLDLMFDSMQQIKPESLTLEGPANRVIGNFKNLLERLVFTFVTNAIINNVRMLKSISKCEPNLKAFNAEEKDLSQENYSKADEKEIELNAITENPNVTMENVVITQKPNDIENGNKNYTSKTALIYSKNYGRPPQKKKVVRVNLKNTGQNSRLKKLKKKSNSQSSLSSSLSDESEEKQNSMSREGKINKKKGSITSSDSESP